MNQTDTDILTLVDPDTFWNTVEVGDPFSCWPWLDVTDDKGYGTVIVRVNDRIRGFRAHRVAYLLANDDTLGDYLVCHHCDNPPCCNPRCLFKGTDQDNQWDRVIKTNERKVIAKLREQILEEYLTGIDASALGKEYGVTATYIKLIIKSAPQAQLDDLRIKRQDRERALAGLPPLHGHAPAVPPALALLKEALAAVGGARVPSQMVLDYLTAKGGRWSAASLARALRDATAELLGSDEKAPRPRGARSTHSGYRNVQHYCLDDLDGVLLTLPTAVPT